jgi:TRAP-type C4-dicarboxylate transport system substrate-binding protein
MYMSAMTRRTLLGALASSPLWLQNAWAQSPTLKISHQYPGGSIAEGDFRDRLCRTFAAEVEKRTRGGVKFAIYPEASLMQSDAQFPALRKGTLDLSLVPLSYASADLPEVNIGLMPGLVTSYDQGYAWKNLDVGKELTRILADKGVVLVSWIWQAGGVASRGKPLVEPDDARGLRVRGGSREMDLILKDAGAAVVTMPSNEIYSGMRSGAMDAALTSSTSLISFRLQEVSKSLTTGRSGAYWFMLEPLMMSKAVYDRLPRDQQATIMAVGAELENFARNAAQEDDAAVASVYQKTGARVVDLNPAALKKWQDIARETAWKDYGARTADCGRLLALAEKTL